MRLRDFLSGCPRTLQVLNVPGPGPGITDTIEELIVYSLVSNNIAVK